MMTGIRSAQQKIKTILISSCWLLILFEGHFSSSSGKCGDWKLKSVTISSHFWMGWATWVCQQVEAGSSLKVEDVPSSWMWEMSLTEKIENSDLVCWSSNSSNSVSSFAVKGERIYRLNKVRLFSLLTSNVK